MLRHLKLGRLLVIMAMVVTAFAIPVSAQDAPSGFNIITNDTGISIFRINSDGTQTRIFYVSATTGNAIDSTTGQGGGGSSSSSSVTSSDVIGTGYLIVNTQSLNVRTGPGTQYTVITTTAGGDQLGVIGRNNGRENWWFVELANGQRGWINNIHVLARGDLSSASVVEHQGVVIASTLYIGYPGNPLFPSVPHQGIPVCYLPGNSISTIVGRSQNSSFYEIQATCQDGSAVTGWVEAIHGIVRNPAGVAFPVTDNN
jgi:uncharacterized protein YraI